jgi:flavin reductase (DIM6/NTAB) family NADH-FMN oxidoreductase RutF
MKFEFASLTAQQRHKLMTSVVLPRPIAWVTTIDAAEQVNVAPFSFFTIVADDPPLIVLGIGDGERAVADDVKDTLANIRLAGEFTIGLVDRAHAEQMAATAVNHPAGVSEADTAALRMAPSVLVRPPRIATSPATMECRLFDLRTLPTRRSIVLGEVVLLHVRDEAVTDPDRLRIDAGRLNPIARLNGDGWYLDGSGYFQCQTPS